MKQLVEIERTGNAAVKKLRENKLKKGHPFMINSNDLPGYQCYLEYPDGSILLVSITKAARDFTIIRQLSKIEENSVRLRFNLSL
ncbi:MAG: hypothetical protein ABIP30_16725 [Ferruginibacter sp.]